MESKAHAFWAGLFVLGLLAVLAGVAVWLTQGHTGARQDYTLIATDSVTGLNREAHVLYRGIRVGKITALGLDPQQPQRVKLTAALSRDLVLSQRVFAKLGTQGLTGVAYVELFDRGDAPPLDRLHAAIPLKPSAWQELNAQLPETLATLRQVGQNLNATLNADNRAQFAALLVQLNVVAARLPALSQRAEATLAETERLLKDLRGLSQAARTTTQQVGTAAAQVGQSSAALTQSALPELVPLLADLRRTTQALDAVLQQQAQNPQQLLFGDPREAPGPGEAGFAPR